MRQQRVLIFGQAEEVRLLLLPRDFRAGGRRIALAVANLGFGFLVVGLVAHRVPTAILFQIDVAGRLHAPPKLLAGRVVAGLGGADKIVVGEVQCERHLLEACRVAVGEFAHAHAFLGRCLLHLEAVLVGAGQEHLGLAV